MSLDDETISAASGGFIERSEKGGYAIIDDNGKVRASGIATFEEAKEKDRYFRNLSKKNGGSR